jgi:hypothetical protein
MAGLQTSEEITREIPSQCLAALPPDQVDAAPECWAKLDQLADIRTAVRTVVGRVHV